MAEHTMTVDDGGGRERRVPVDYPSNANSKPPGDSKPKPEKEPIQGVISGKVRRKSSKSSAFAEVGKSVWQYVLTEVLMPSLKDTVYEMITGGSQRAIYRDDRPLRHGPTNYNRFQRAGSPSAPTTNPYTRRTVSPQTRSTHIFDEIILETRDEADAVLNSINDLVGQYGYATVADLFTLCNIDSQFTDGQWGWTDREAVNIRIMMIHGGYLIKTPPTVPITVN